MLLPAELEQYLEKLDPDTAQAFRVTLGEIQTVKEAGVETQKVLRDVLNAILSIPKRLDEFRVELQPIYSTLEGMARRAENAERAAEAVETRFREYLGRAEDRPTRPGIPTLPPETGEDSG